jgi:type II secretion system protein N
MRLSSRHKKILVWVGYPLLALVSFVFTLAYTFPYERLRDRITDALADKYDVTIASIDHSFLPGGIKFGTVMLKSRPTHPGEKPVILVLDKVDVRLGLFALITGHTSASVTASIGGGTIDGDISLSKSGAEASIETDGLPLGNLPGVGAAVGLPMSGGLDAEIELHLPGNKWKNAEGKIALSCKACTVGDGVTKMKMRPAAGRRPSRAAAFASEGITVPRLDLGNARVEVDITRGVGTIKTFAASSKDGTLKIDGKIEFKDPFALTTFPGCMTFSLSDDLRKREPDFSNVEFMLPARAKQADGSFAIPTKGKLTELRWDVKRQCSGASTAEPDTTPDRPVLTTPTGRTRPRVDTPPTPAPTEPVTTPSPGTSGPELSGEKSKSGSEGESGSAEPATDEGEQEHDRGDDHEPGEDQPAEGDQAPDVEPEQ